MSFLPAPPIHNRKSPIRHTVRSHQRSAPSGYDVHVHQYERGSGKPSKPKIKLSLGAGVGGYLTDGKTGFEVTVKYDNGSPETLDVDSVGLVNALDEAFTKRSRSDAVRSVVLRRL